MNTNRDDLNTFDMTYVGTELDDVNDNAMSDEEYAVWCEAEARRDYEAYVTAQADEEAGEAEEWQRMERAAADMDDDDLTEAAEEARVMFPNSPWGRLVIAAHEERLAG